MPTYDEEVLTDTPVAYWKLEELIGTTLTDTSGNGFTGTIRTPPPTFGIAGPIETDALSFGMDGAVGYYYDAGISGSDIDLRDAFTWEVWGRYDGGTQLALLTRNGLLSLNASNWIYIHSGVPKARISFDSGAPNTYDLSSPDAVPTGAWYHIVVTRNTNVMRIYVNSLLKNERTDLPVDPIVFPSYNESSWKLGGGVSSVTTSTGAGGVFPAEGLARVALYATASSDARQRARYEAAIASLPVAATIIVRVVVELDTDQVDPIDFPFVHNFAEPLSGSARPITEHLSWKTNINQSEPDYQQRVNAQPYHAERTLEYFVTPTSARARAMMQAALWTPGQTYKLPIAKDWGLLTAQGTAGASILSLDTTLRDYEIGSYVCVWEDVYEPWTAQFFEITSRTDTQLGITPNVGTTLPIGSTVMPARLAILPEDSLAIDSHLIDRETAALQFEILSTELSSRRVTAYTPATTYLSIEVFDLERARVEWVDPAQYQINRRFQGTGTPTGNDYQRAVDTGSPQTVPIRVLLASRAAYAEFLGWLDDRQGKQNPVWVVSEESDLNVTARTNTTITIDHIGYAALYNVHSARRHVAFKKTDGSTVYKMITAAVNNGDGTETLSVATPPALADIVKTSFLRLCTAPDQFEMRYHRDGSDFIAECDFVMTELLTTPE